jgi:hypothetical protein
VPRLVAEERVKLDDKVEGAYEEEDAETHSPEDCWPEAGLAFDPFDGRARTEKWTGSSLR